MVDKDRGPNDMKNSSDSASLAAGDAGSGSCATGLGSSLSSDTDLGVPVPFEAVEGALPGEADRSDGACSKGEKKVENGGSTDTEHVGVKVGDARASSLPHIDDSTHPTPPPEDHAAVAVAAGTSAGLSHDNVSGISQHNGEVEDGKKENDDIERQNGVQGDVDASDARTKEAEAAAKAWGITPGRLTMLVKTLLKEADEWGEDAKHLR